MSLKRFTITSRNATTRHDATLLEVARWVFDNGTGKYVGPTHKQFQYLCHVNVGGYISNPKAGWKIVRGANA